MGLLPSSFGDILGVSTCCRIFCGQCTDISRAVHNLSDEVNNIYKQKGGVVEGPGVTLVLALGILVKILGTWTSDIVCWQVPILLWILLSTEWVDSFHVPTFLFSHCQQERHCVTLQSNLRPAPTLRVFGARALFHLTPPLSKSSAWYQRVRQRTFRNVPAGTKRFLLYSFRAH